MQDSQPTAPRLTFVPGAKSLRVDIDTNGIHFSCPMPRLAGPESQCLATGASVRQLDDGALLEGSDGDLSGVLLAEENIPLEEASEKIFNRLFSLLDGRHIRRIWSFVPAINQRVDGRENYLSFNAGRHKAFTRLWGEILPDALPAASALGIDRARLGLAFSAGSADVSLFENPLQVPACRYPERYGKLPPLFARGSSSHHDGQEVWHLSGTASIKGSDTIGLDINKQLATTIENSRIVIERMGVPADLPGCWKVFLRHAHDLDAARAALENAWPGAAHQWLYLRADICRSSLLVEVEAAFDTSIRAALVHA
ncbi:MAG: hypothetical protein ACKO2G_11320 [Verrucomicrobiales bacterium]